MHRTSRPELRAIEVAHAASPTNYAHDHGAMSPVGSLAAVPTVNPEPAYIAASAASQIVTSEYQSQHPHWDEGNASPLMNEVALVSPASLSLINAFLDRILFNFLASARSTSLASLRPAVIEVLKPRLAKEAIAGADEELQEFLGGGDDEELEDFHNGQDSQDEWDLELVWKRTRLRCMVYTRLGDMEEEDEEIYIEQEHLEDSTSPRRLSRDFGIVSPAVAIFLTSILEFVGEHALMIAGEAAYRRCEIRCRTDRRRSEASQRVIVEETDMEKVALNPTLGRLWRSWRKLLRSPRTSISRIMSREMVSHKGLAGFSTSRSTSRQSSIGAADAVYMHSSLDRRPSVAEILGRPDPASIPLPLTDYDVAEIEVPGYSPHAVPASTEPNRLQQRSLSSVRVRELSQHPPQSPEIGTSTSVDQEQASKTPFPSAPAFLNRHVRSRSLPTPTKASFGESNRSGSVMTHAGDASQLSKAPMSVLNAISKHAARELQVPETTSLDRESDANQAKGVKQSEESEYKRASMNGSTKPLIASLAKPREDPETRYSTSSSVHTLHVGNVSPMDPAYIESGEVSPIDGSDDEDEIYQATAVTAATLRRATDKGRIVSTEYDPGQVLPRQMPEEDERGDQYRSNRLATGRQRGMDGPTEDDYAKDEKREAFVVLEDFPKTHSTRSSDASVLSGKDLQADGTISNLRARMPGTENGVPPLTPLREMMEAASGSEDDASSFEPTHVEHTRYSPSTVRTVSQSSNLPTPNGTKFTEARSQLPAVYTGPPPAGVERAGVQRVSPSPGGHREPSTPQERISESSMQDQQSNYAQPPSSSPVSLKTKARAVSQSGGNGLVAVASRTSTEGNKAVPEGRYRRGSSLSGDKERDFEQLINSNATIQYTLTPQNMREIEGPELPQYQSSRPQVVSRSGRTSGEQSRPVTGRSHTPSVSKEVKRALESNVGNFPAAAGPTFIIHSGPPVKRGPQAQARDARVENDNIRDFADFIRSTGPEEAKSLPRLPTAISTKSSSTISNTKSQKTSTPTSPRTLVKSPPGVNPIIAPLISENKALKMGGVKLQAREATISRNDETSDLIDFIRQGPPSEQKNGNHRIPRTVAPFRTTMDSDDMQAASPSKPKDSNSLTSTQDSLVAKSLQSSVNSRTALLESSNRQGSKLSSPPTAMHSHRFHEPPQPPIRKQRRVRDPYEIESDSDLDEEVSRTPKPQFQEPQEESLLDFLNSMPPPDANFDPPPLDIPQSAIKGMQRKNSSSIRSRFSRTANNTVKPSAKKGNAPPKSAPSSSYTSGPVATSRIPEESMTQPQQPQPKIDTYKQSSPTYSNGGERLRAGMVKSIAKPVQARSATTTDSVRDLADFLKNSGPPEPPASRAGASSTYSGTTSKEDAGGFSRMFSRRKKLAGVAS